MRGKLDADAAAEAVPDPKRSRRGQGFEELRGGVGADVGFSLRLAAANDASQRTRAVSWSPTELAPIEAW